MAYRAAHGNGAKSALARVETLPVDELPAGIPAGSGVATPPKPDVKRTADGRMADREAARELGKRGALAAAARRRELRSLQALGLRGAQPAELAPYLDDAGQFAEAEVGRLAASVGGGMCPPNAAALVHQAALAMAGSRAAYAAGETALGARLGAEVRQNLLGAYELCAREAAARPRLSNPTLAAIEAAGEDST